MFFLCLQKNTMFFHCNSNFNFNYLVSAFSLLPLFFFITSTSLCLPSQSSALLQFKQALLPSSSTRLASWINGSDCCNWSGVTCDAATGYITALRLSTASSSGELVPLSGDISSAVFTLARLTYLDLSYNSFVNKFPSGFSKLTQLRYLNLSNSGFSGQIPAEISRMKRLVSLDLSTSYLTLITSSYLLKLQKPDFAELVGGLTELRYLYLDGVGMINSSRAIPANSSLSKLQNLSLSNCFLTGNSNTVQSVFQLNSLAYLDLSQNDLGRIPTMNLSSLRYLSLSSCSVTSDSLFNDVFGKMPKLQFLDVSNNPGLVGELPQRDISKSMQLEVLILSSTNLTGNLPESIGNVKNLRILKINNCNFSGTIPASFANLDKLEILDVSFNNFTGEIPDLRSPKIMEIYMSSNNLSGPIPQSFTQLANLSTLNLRNNNFTGSIPNGLFDLPQLKMLDLSQNNLDGTIWNSSMNGGATSLMESLDISYNWMIGEIPHYIGSMRNLKVLMLSSNSFNGTLDFSLFMSLRNLSRLDLSENDLSVLLSNSGRMMKFPHLATLKLRSCKLTTFPEFLRDQQTLTTLDLSNNSIIEDIPSWLWRSANSSLTYLDLSENNLTGSVEGVNLLNSPSLLMLDLHSNRLMGSVADLFAISAVFLDFSKNMFTSSIPSLSPSILFLSVANNHMNGTIPDSICNTSLILLDLSYNSFTGKIPSCLSNLTELTILNLRKNKLQGEIPGTFGEGCKLRTLNLNANSLNGGIPKSLSSCRNLEVLDLGYNELIDKFPSWLNQLRSLQVLVLRNNHLYGPVGKTEQGFESLQIVDISANQLSGLLPYRWLEIFKAMIKREGSKSENPKFVEFQYLFHAYYQDTVNVTIKGMDFQMTRITTILTAIDISSNSFSGQIPEELGLLDGLYGLNMSRNNLTGSIPTSFGHLNQMESLDLSYNQLSGDVPIELLNLTFLSVLNLSYNNLTGVIPHGKQFLTFNASSYIGNPGLCGPPLPGQCPDKSNRNVGTHNSNQGGFDELEFLHIAAGLGFGAGWAIVLMPTIFMGGIRKWFFDQVDGNIVVWICAPFDWYVEMKDRQMVKHDSEDADTNGNEAVGHLEDISRYFCVFCTELGRNGAVAMHNKCHCQAK